jgi:hypothetical protein
VLRHPPTAPLDPWPSWWMWGSASADRSIQQTQGRVLRLRAHLGGTEPASAWDAGRRLVPPSPAAAGPRAACFGRQPIPVPMSRQLRLPRNTVPRGSPAPCFGRKRTPARKPRTCFGRHRASDGPSDLLRQAPGARPSPTGGCLHPPRTEWVSHRPTPASAGAGHRLLRQPAEGRWEGTRRPLLRSRRRPLRWVTRRPTKGSAREGFGRREFSTGLGRRGRYPHGFRRPRSPAAMDQEDGR